MNHLGTKRIETERLILRPFKADCENHLLAGGEEGVATAQGAGEPGGIPVHGVGGCGDDHGD